METIDNIILDEGGCRTEPYLCTAGKLTWLIGRNIEDRPITTGEWDALRTIVAEGGGLRDWAHTLFIAELAALRTELYNIGVDVRNLPEQVHAIIVNMAYNMGTTRFNTKRWPKFFGAVAKRDWITASYEMKNSKWYHDTKSRAVRLTRAMLDVES